MGNNYSNRPGAQGACVVNNQAASNIRSVNPQSPSTSGITALLFHQVHGENIRLFKGELVARRVESFCKGVAFTNRPLRVNERITVKFCDIASSWSGVMRFGFTSNDPATLRGSTLPKYACPDLTNKPGYWAKALYENFAVKNTVLTFYVTASGDVHYSINGDDKGVFFSGVETRGPLWAMFDIYGNTAALEIINNNDRQTRSSGGVCNPPRRTSVVAPTAGTSCVDLGSCNDQASMRSAGICGTSAQARNEGLLIPVGSNQPPPLVAGATPTGSDIMSLPLVYNRGVQFTELSFHQSHGRNMELLRNRTVASRQITEYNRAYVFTQRPVLLGERVVLQILHTEDMYVGSMAFGLTTCDPATLDGTVLPEDSDLLLDRMEYWVVTKDVANCPNVGDELSFTVSSRGEVFFSKNNGPPSTVMHVDQTQRLFMFFDIYGHTQKVRLIGTTHEQVTPSLRSAPAIPSETPPRPPLRVTLPPLGLNLAQQPSDLLTGSPLVTAAPSFDQSVDMESNECTVCYEKQIDCVLYDCGHMCMCYECARQLFARPSGGLCPICRAKIKDVIKTFKS